MNRGNNALNTFLEELSREEDNQYCFDCGKEFII